MAAAGRARRGIRGLVEATGAAGLEGVRLIGGVTLLVRDALGHAILGPFRGRPVRAKAFWTQSVRVGPRALGVVFLVNFFVGVILALIGGNILQDLGFTRYIGNLMSVGIVVELGPLLTAV